MDEKLDLSKLIGDKPVSADSKAEYINPEFLNPQ